MSAGQPTEKKAAQLERQLQNTTGKERVAVLNKLAGMFYLRDPGRAVTYGKDALALANKIDDQKGKARSLIYMANAYRVLGKIDKPFEYARQALEISTQLEEKKTAVNALNTMGFLYNSINSYDEAQKHLIQALNICDLHRLPQKKTGILYQLGSMYNNINQQKKALECYREILRMTDDKNLKARVFTNIGLVYVNLKRDDTALEYFNRALKIYRQSDDAYNISASLSNICALYIRRGRHREALVFLNEAIKKSEEIGRPKGIAGNLLYIADIYRKSKQYEEADLNYKKALKIADEIGDNKCIRSAYEKLSRLYTEKGDYKQALDYHLLFTQWKDRIINEEKNKQIAQLEIRYETEKRAREIKVLKKNSKLQAMTRNALLTVLLLVLVILALLFKKYLHLFAFWKKEKYIGQYHLIEEVGAGGMSNVYKAHNVRDKNEIRAVKVLKAELFKKETNRKRFKQEAVIIDKLVHPNIIRIFERGEYNDRLYIVMEFLDGIDLAEKIETEKNLLLGDCLHIMKQLADALAFIHSRNIIHRDMKPANVMVIHKNHDPNHIMLLDFGLSRMKFQSRLTRTGVLVGTLNYMAPEQISDLHYSAAGDIYALGIIFYELLTGRTAYQGETFSAVEAQILKNKLTEPMTFRAGIPVKLNRLVMEMVAKEPRLRPTAKSVLLCLEDIETLSGTA
jgi:tetratricopeptide (TPR) repeat protein/tRNA A-37 threonylcarbamoyl transferase component Bud32